MRRSSVDRFGDPGSGYNNSSAVKKPRHVFAAPGSYTVTLDVVYPGMPTINLSTVIKVITPMSYNFGPDVYLCEDQKTVLNAPAVPGAVVDSGALPSGVRCGSGLFCY